MDEQIACRLANVGGQGKGKVRTEYCMLFVVLWASAGVSRPSERHYCSGDNALRCLQQRSDAERRAVSQVCPDLGDEWLALSIQQGQISDRMAAPLIGRVWSRQFSGKICP